MTNKEIARAFADLASIMELHNENPFKIKSYQNAYITLRKLDTSVETMTKADLDVVKGIGKSTSEKIMELLKTGEMSAFRLYADKTPSGVVEMLGIKGFGPKKIQAVWQELGIETVGELLYACNENRLIELHGFGKKTQEELRKSIEYFLKSRNKVHWATAEIMTDELVKNLKLKIQHSETLIERVGEVRRLLPVVEKIELLVAGLDNASQLFDNEHLILLKENADSYFAKTEDNFPVIIYMCALSDFGSKMFKYSGSRLFLESFVKYTEGVDFRGLPTEQAVFEKANLPFIPSELRESAAVLDLAKNNQLPELINLGDIKGVIHTHTTWSDGLHSTREMAKMAQHLGSWRSPTTTSGGTAAPRSSATSVHRWSWTRPTAKSPR